MMKKRNYFFLSVLITLSLLTGCNGKERKVSQPTLRLAFYGDVRNKPFGEALIAAFQKSHPSIRIKPIFIDTESWEQKLLTMIAGGDAPDIMLLFPYSSMMNFASKGQLLNLQPYINGDKEFQSFKNDIYSNCWKVTQYKNESYAVPFWTNSLVLFYNKDLFDEEKISYPDKSWNWDKLLSVGKRLTKDINRDGIIDHQYAFFPFNAPTILIGLYKYIRQNDARLFNEDMSKCLIDSPAAIEAIRWCFDLINKYKISPSPTSGDERLGDYEQAFLTGKVAMTISGRWSVPWFSKAKFKWGCAPLPKGKVIFKAAAGVTLLGAYSKTKYPEECWEFLKFMMEKEAQETVCDLKADMPVRMSVANSPKFLNWLSRPQENKVFLEELMDAEEFPHFPEEKEWLDRANQKLQAALLGKKNLKTACEEIAKEYQRFKKQ